MKIKDGFVLRTVAGSDVVVSVGARALDFNGMIQLNQTAAFLWKRLEAGATEEELIRSTLEAYSDVEEAEARRHVQKFLSSLREAGCLDD